MPPPVFTVFKKGIPRMPHGLQTPCSNRPLSGGGETRGGSSSPFGTVIDRSPPKRCS